jgi:hypothetical protein
MNKSRNLSRENSDDQYVLTTKKEALFSLLYSEGKYRKVFQNRKGKKLWFYCRKKMKNNHQMQ